MLRTFFKRLLAKKPALFPVGQAAPDFALADHHGGEVRLADLRGRRVVLFFYPKADTPGCTRQSCAFRDRHADYAKKGIVVLGVSFDSPAENRAFAEKYGFPYRLLSDVDRRVALAYRACDTPADEYPRRVTYVIGADGRVEQAVHTEDPGRQADELLARLRGPAEGG